MRKAVFLELWVGGPIFVTAKTRYLLLNLANTFLIIKSFSFLYQPLKVFNNNNAKIIITTLGGHRSRSSLSYVRILC